MRHRNRKTRIEWGPDFAYAIGLIASDGNLSPDGRHISLCSKDLDMVQNFQAALSIQTSIGRKARGSGEERRYYVVQFSDIRFYEFLLSIGLTPAKSKSMRALAIPKYLFIDFLRGYFDGDGCISSYSHPASTHLQIRVTFSSASQTFFEWLLSELKSRHGIIGGSICIQRSARVINLSFGKSDSAHLIKLMYYSSTSLCLARKRVKAHILLAGSRT